MIELIKLKVFFIHLCYCFIGLYFSILTAICVGYYIYIYIRNIHLIVINRLILCIKINLMVC